MPKRETNTEKDAMMNRAYSGYTADGAPRDWTFNAGTMPHAQYKRWWDAQFPEDAVARRVEELKREQNASVNILRNIK